MGLYLEKRGKNIMEFFNPVKKYFERRKAEKEANLRAIARANNAFNDLEARGKKPSPEKYMELIKREQKREKAFKSRYR